MNKGKLNAVAKIKIREVINFADKWGWPVDQRRKAIRDQIEFEREYMNLSEGIREMFNEEESASPSHDKNR